MTDKQLEQMRINSTRNPMTITSAYKAGALDMQEKMIDKACEIFRKIACEWYKPAQGRYTDMVVDNIIKTKFLPPLNELADNLKLKEE